MRRGDGVFRVCRFLWTRGKVGDGKGYSAKFSVGLERRLIGFERGYAEWHLWLVGIRLHYQRAYGGVIV